MVTHVTSPPPSTKAVYLQSWSKLKNVRNRQNRHRPKASKMVPSASAAVVAESDVRMVLRMHRLPTRRQLRLTQTETMTNKMTRVTPAKTAMPKEHPNPPLARRSVVGGRSVLPTAPMPPQMHLQTVR
jgi:hypothetical protein